MKNTAYKTGILAALAILFLAGGCIHDDFEAPETEDIPTGNTLTIGEIRQMYTDSVESGAYPEGYKFTGDFSLYCVCTMDDKSGNIYKSAYVQDETGAINLHLMSSGGLYQGDSVRIYLKDLILGDYENMLQLDSVSVDDNIVKLATEQEKEPELVEISQITGAYQGKLIKLENVQFVEADINKTFADADNLITENRTLEDCNGQTIDVRTSGYADFADYPVPDGKGTLIAIASQFRDDWQLFIRHFHEVDMDGLRCGEYDDVFYEDFDSLTLGDPIALEGWNNIASAGSILWTGKNSDKVNSAYIDGTTSGESDIQSWLITPEIDLSGINGGLSFATRGRDDRGAVLKVMISEDYDGTADPQNATWTELSADISDAPTSGFAQNWTASGDIDISSYTGAVHIAFKYEGTDANTGKYYLDEFMVFNQ
ncbi:MAG: DUF5689 domain-containing protein [Bacteroidota bacterium]